jgi:hypothetical protein
MDQRAGFSLSIGRGNIHDIVIRIVDEMNCCEWMIITEIKATEVSPILRNDESGNKDVFVCDGEYTTAAKRRNSLKARLTLVARVRGNDDRALLRRVMQRIVDRHCRDVALRAILEQKPTHNVAHALQGRERHIDGGIGDSVGAGQTLGIDVLWRLVIIPDQIKRLALEFLSSLIVTLKSQHAILATDMADNHVINRISNPTFERDPMGRAAMKSRPSAN